MASNAETIKDAEGGGFLCEAIRSFKPISTTEVEELLFDGFRGSVNKREASEAPYFLALQSMKNLLSLILVDCSTPLFIEVLQITEPEIICPSLRKLTIYLSPEGSFGVTGLGRLLSMRKERGVPLDTLILVAKNEDKRIPDNVLGKLRRYVDEVEFRIDPQIP